MLDPTTCVAIANGMRNKALMVERFLNHDVSAFKIAECLRAWADLTEAGKLLETDTNALKP